MILGKSEIPKTLKECLRPNQEAMELREWAERIKGWGVIVFFILCFIGFVVSIMAGKSSISSQMNEFMGDTSTFDWASFFGSLFAWVIYAVIECCAYNVLVLLINSLASIIENTKITANVALYKSQLEETQKKDSMIVKEPIKVKEKKVEVSNENVVKEGMIVCPVCGTEQESNRSRCFECGIMFS